MRGSICVFVEVESLPGETGKRACRDDMPAFACLINGYVNLCFHSLGSSAWAIGLQLSSKVASATAAAGVVVATPCADVARRAAGRGAAAAGKTSAVSTTPEASAAYRTAGAGIVLRARDGCAVASAAVVAASAEAAIAVATAVASAIVVATTCLSALSIVVIAVAAVVSAVTSAGTIARIVSAIVAVVAPIVVVEVASFAPSLLGRTMRVAHARSVVEVHSVVGAHAAVVVTMPESATIGQVDGGTAEVVVAVAVAVEDGIVPTISGPPDGTQEVVNGIVEAILPVEEHVAKVFVSPVPVIAGCVRGIVDVEEVVEVDLIGAIVLLACQVQLVSHLVGKEPSLLPGGLIVEGFHR